MSAGKPWAYKDNECGGREGDFGMRNKLNGYAKLEYKPVQNGIKDYERGHGQGYDQDSLEYRSKVRQKDVKERAVTNGGYLSISSRSDSGSSGSGGSRKHGLARSTLDREPGELWSDGSDEVIDSETRIDKGPDKENVENVSQVKNKKRKFSPIVWDKDDKEVSRTIKSRDTIVTTNLPPSPALLKPKFSLEEDGPTSPTDNKQISLEASPSKVDLRSDLSEFPAETLPMPTEDQRAKMVETVSPNDDYIPPRTIIFSRWANDADSHADGGEISDYILKLKRNSGVEPTDAGTFNKCASPEVGEVKIEGSQGSGPDGCDRSSSRDCYCEEGNNGYVEIDTDRNYDGARASHSDTESEDSCFSHGTLKPLHRQQRSVNMLQGCRSVDEFERLNKINEGTYGIVYRAKDKRTGDIVALKKVKMDKEREGFPLTSLREINILLSCDHPSIVDVKEVVVGSSLDSIFMVMEYMEHDLKELTETMKQPFSQSEVKCLMLQLLSGVKYLHDNWVIHRDLKTSNLLLNNCGALKICDFGLARQYGSPLKPYTPLVVTLWYRSPELLLGAKQYSTAIDMWSLGCIMAELLLKEPLFKGKTEFDQLDKIFKMLGTPNETIWPGYSKLPGVKVNFIQHQYNLLRRKFQPISFTGSPLLSDAGFDLLNRLLTYDPQKRISAEEALDHAWFCEVPLPKEKEFMPTFPAHNAQDRRMRRVMKSPGHLEDQHVNERQQVSKSSS